MPPKPATSPRHVQSLVATVTAVYEANINPSKATGMSKYMRGLFPYLGLATPLRRGLDKKEIWASYLKDKTNPPSLSEEDNKALVHALWDRPQREYQYFVMDHIDKAIHNMSSGFISTLQFTIATKSWWDTVDMIASKHVGPLVSRYPESLLPVMDEWIQHENLWVRRTAILHQLNYKDKTDKHRLFRYCEAQMHDTDFFIRKAIGWSLRQYARVNAEDVRQFVGKNKDSLSTLSIREALKHIGPPKGMNVEGLKKGKRKKACEQEESEEESEGSRR